MPRVKSNPFDDYDAFLDDATHCVAELWEKRRGLLKAKELSEDEMYDLNDALTAFFNVKVQDYLIKEVEPSNV